MVDLNKTDIYSNYTVPDADVELCLKVIRTLRNYYLGPQYFDANAGVVLSHAHAVIHDAVAEVQDD